jgi:hypothetical protein
VFLQLIAGHEAPKNSRTPGVAQGGLDLLPDAPKKNRRLGGDGGWLLWMQIRIF